MWSRTTARSSARAGTATLPARGSIVSHGTGFAIEALAREGGQDYLAMPATGHLLQLARPAAYAEAVREFLARIALK